MPRLLLVDDEPLARERLRRLLAALVPAAELREAPDGDAAVAAIRDWAPDAVFLDIQMPGRDGFQVIAAVGVERMPATVFVTGYDQHALRAFEVAAVDYLLKPFDDARLAEAWRRVDARLADRTLAGEARRFAALLGAVGAAAPAPAPAYLERFLVKHDERTTLVPVSEVRFIRSDGNYLELHTATSTHMVRDTLGEVERGLDPARFVRIHRRVIVAISEIKELQPWFGGDQVMLLKDGTKLRVSRTRREAVAARLAGRPA